MPRAETCTPRLASGIDAPDGHCYGNEEDTMPNLVYSDSDQEKTFESCPPEPAASRNQHSGQRFHDTAPVTLHTPADKTQQQSGDTDDDTMPSMVS